MADSSAFLPLIQTMPFFFVVCFFFFFCISFFRHAFVDCCPPHLEPARQSPWSCCVIIVSGLLSLVHSSHQQGQAFIHNPQLQFFIIPHCNQLNLQKLALTGFPFHHQANRACCRLHRRGHKRITDVSFDSDRDFKFRSMMWDKFLPVVLIEDIGESQPP